jgi:hypothetical protein
MITFSVSKARHLSEKSDFYQVFWKPGQDFSTGQTLYYREIHRPFNYPPVTAFFLQPLHWLPYRVSALIFILINTLVIIPVCFLILFKLLLLPGLDRRRIFVSLLVSGLFTVQYFWNNLVMLNINAIVLTIILLGIYSLAKGKPHVSGILFTFVTFIKLMPVVLLVYVFIRYFSLRVFLYIALTVLTLLFLPAAFRGMDQWISDHKGFYEYVIRPYIIEGSVVTEETNHKLKSGLVKAMYPEVRERIRVDPDNYPLALTINNIITLVFLGILVFNGILMYRRNIAFSISYFSSLIIFTHLISGLTWSAHLVSLVYCFLPVILIVPGKLKWPGKTFYYIALTGFLFLGMEGLDTYGPKVYHAIRMYDLYTLLLLGLFLFSSWVVWNSRSRSLYPEYLPR